MELVQYAQSECHAWLNANEIDVVEASRDKTRSVDFKNTQKLGFVNNLHNA